jgi:dUTP pyrophosphatase
MLKLKYKKHHPEARIDPPAKEGDVGYDVYAIVETVIPAGMSRSIPIGLSFEPPEGYYMVVETRSTHGVMNGLRCHSGIIDNGYRGIPIIQVYNHNIYGEYIVKKGEKVAQLVLHKSEVMELEECQDLSGTERGDSGFGSTNEI